jgi:hypothetical protein
MKIEFVEFSKVYGEKHLGIATVNFDDLMYLRYKVQPGKDGKGYFFQCASYKVGEEYVPSFLINQRFHEAAVDKVLREGVKPFLGNESESQAMMF